MRNEKGTTTFCFESTDTEGAFADGKVNAVDHGGAVKMVSAKHPHLGVISVWRDGVDPVPSPSLREMWEEMRQGVIV